VVLAGELPKKIQEAAEMYAGCVAGACQKKEYLKYIEQTCFKNITLQKENPIILPDEILQKYLTSDEIMAYKIRPIIFSITVYAEKQDCCCSSVCC